MPETNVVQVISLCLKRNNSQVQKNLFPIQCVCQIGRTCFNEDFLFHVITGIHYCIFL